MSAEDSITPDSTSHSRLIDDVVDSVEALSGSEIDGGLSNEEHLQTDKNATRHRRLKLQRMASKFGLTDEEVKVLASAGLMMPDVFEAMMIGDIGSRVDAVQDYAKARVQYTNLLVPPRDMEDYLEVTSKPIKINSKPYIRNEKSLSELMIAVRGSAKMLDGIAVAYQEQHAFHRELLRIVVERQQVARAMRSSPPKYLLDFARLLESLGCERNHLRSVDGRFMRALRGLLGLAEGDADRVVDREAERFRSWLAEEDALAEAEGFDDNSDVVDDEFDRLSRVATKALMDGDLEAARSAFAELESFDTSLEDSFGADELAASSVTDEVNYDEDVTVEAGPIGELAEAGNMTAPGPVADENPDAGAGDGSGHGIDDRSESAARALTAEGHAGVPALPVAGFGLGLPVSGNKEPSAPPKFEPSTSPTVERTKPQAVLSAALAAGPAIPARPPSVSVISPEPVSVSATDGAGKSDQSVSLPPRGPSHFKGWAIEVPEGIEGRVTGIGRLPCRDPFGGVVSTAAQTPDVVPMWDRVDRQASNGDLLTLDDWYRFEVPFGPYALVHMPKRLNDYLPVRSEMFPPYLQLERYGQVAGLSPSDMLSLKVADLGRGSMDVAIRAIQSVLIIRYGKINEDLLRFWMFLLLGRRFMKRIDELFPHGYFHGVMAPDPAAEKVGTGFFRIVRVLDDGDLSAQMRQPKFAPFGTPDAGSTAGAKGSSPAG